MGMQENTTPTLDRISSHDAARTNEVVYFYLGRDSPCLTDLTLNGEIGYYYRAVLCYGPVASIQFREYPYYLNGDGKWSMVGRPVIDLMRV